MIVNLVKNMRAILRASFMIVTLLLKATAMLKSLEVQKVMLDIFRISLMDCPILGINVEIIYL